MNMNAAPLYKRRGDFGVSFAEVIVTMLILTMGIIPVMNVISRGTEGTVMTRDEIFAHQFASEMIDYCQALGYDEIPTGEVKNLTFADGSVLPIDQRFTREVKISETASAEDLPAWPKKYKIVVVDVSWNNGGIIRHYFLSGMIAKGRATGGTP